jgi:hypothetical protein
MDEHTRLGIIRRDTAAGLLLLVLAAAIVVGAFDLPIGTPLRMGAGFLPLCIGIALAVAGTAVLIGGLRDTEPLPSFRNLRPIAALAASFLVFAAMLEPWGLVAAVVGTVLVASLATPVRRLWELPLYAAGLAAFSLLLFVELLGLPMKVWP